MLDIDNFKQVNDQFGHLVGDLALVMLAKTLKQQLRSVDLCCRYGGEEFVLCLPDTHIEGAREVAERIRVAISLQSIPSNDARTLSISISLGVAGNQQNQSVEDILKQADMALYKAKGNGRNQTCIAN
jgi:diguanylate cyclase (GGDEF)-like protein